MTWSKVKPLRPAGTVRPATADLTDRLRSASIACSQSPLRVVIDTLSAAGFDDLDATELRLLGWLCGWEPETVGALVGLMIAGGAR